MTTSKVAFITGASTGIGRATAELMIKKGFTVYATARRTHLMADLEKAGAKVLSVRRDERRRHPECR